jgi:seryl-tRNA synthetase
VRGIKVTKYVIEARGAARTEQLERLSRGLATIMSGEGGLILTFGELGEKELQQRAIDRLLRTLVAKPEAQEQRGVMVPFGTVLWQGQRKHHALERDVSEEAERLGWIKRFPSRGQWIYTPPMAGLIKALSDLIVERVADPLGFELWVFPRLLPMEVLKKLSTYVEHLPEGMFYVCAPPRDPRAFEEFKREYALKRVVRTDLLKGLLQEPAFVLDAVQCPPFYQYFSEETVRLEDLPIKAYDYLGGWTWRNEAGGVEGIVRTNEFLRMEMVMLGRPEEVVELRNSVIDRTVELLDKELDMEWRVVAGAPFYLAPEEARKHLVDASSKDRIPTLDIECYLPYRGPREGSEWLELTAATVHKTFYVDAFRIREQKGRPIWTGCIGHGLSRWAAAFLARHGFNIDEWPSEVRRRYRRSEVPLGPARPPP